MLCLDLFIFIYLGLVSITCGDSFPKEITSIAKYVKLSYNNQDFVKEITVLGSLKYKIFTYNPEGKTNEEQTMAKVNAFYLVSSCSFAERIIYCLRDFVLYFPLFYSHTFLNSKYENEFINNLHKFTNKLKSIGFEIIQFIHFLNNFMKNTISHSSYYTDNTIIKILVILKTKIDILSSTKKHKSWELNDSDVIVIREMLEEITELQIFLSLNCDNSTHQSANNYNSHLYGYMTTEQNKDANNILIKKFLVTLDSDKCSIQQTLLQSFVGTKSTDPDFAHDIGNTKSKIQNKEEMYIKIKDVFKQIQLSHDASIMYWYQKSIFATIMKLTYSKIIEGMQKSYLTHSITHMIRDINTVIAIQKQNYPTDLVNGFALLKYANNRNKFDNDDDYVNNVKMLYDYYTDITPSIQLIGYKISFDDINTSNKNDEDYTEDEESVFQKYLMSLMTTIKENLQDFLCFNRNFSLFENEFKKKYLPYNIFKNTKIKSTDNVAYFNECYFIIDMYFICYKSVVFLNKSIDQENNKEQLEKFNYLKKAQEAIDNIRNHFVVLRSIEKKNVEFVQMGNDIVTILANVPMWNKNKQRTERKHLQRIINFIMAKLNSYGLQYCTLPKFNFLLFNNVHFIKFREYDTEKMYETSKVKWKNMDMKIAKVKPEDYQCFNYKYLYKTFFQNKFDVLKPYTDYIQLQWKGKHQPIQRVFADLNNLFFNSYHLYIFYDIYFLFHTAALYYELNQIYRCSQTEKIPEDRPDNTYCPQHFESLVSKIEIIETNMKNMYKKDTKMNFNEIGSILEKIKNEITNFNINFVYKNNKNSEKICNSDSDSNNYTSQTNAIIDNMSNLYNDCYLEIIINSKSKITLPPIKKIENTYETVEKSGMPEFKVKTDTSLKPDENKV